MIYIRLRRFEYDSEHMYSYLNARSAYHTYPAGSDSGFSGSWFGTIVVDGGITDCDFGQFLFDNLGRISHRPIISWAYIGACGRHLDDSRDLLHQWLLRPSILGPEDLDLHSPREPSFDVPASKYSPQRVFHGFRRIRPRIQYLLQLYKCPQSDPRTKDVQHPASITPRPFCRLCSPAGGVAFASEV